MRLFYILVLGVLLMAACGKEGETVAERSENAEAKRLMQGIWISDDDGQPSFRVTGDSIFFPGETGAPLRFAVIDDTLFMYGSNTMKYPVVRQTENVFEFKNQTGETVRLTRSTDADADMFFFEEKPIVINQRQTIKRDTVIMVSNERYHFYTQVNPTTYKVYKSAYNDEGVEIDDVFYDNSIYLSVYKGTEKMYGHEFVKADFSGYIPDEALRQTILSDILLDTAHTDTISYHAMLAIPDSPSSYILRITLSIGDGIKMNIEHNDQ